MSAEATATTAQVIAPGSSPAATSPPTVTIALDDYHEFRSVKKQFEDFKSAQAAELATKETARLEALAESGKSKQALEEQRKAYDTKLNEEAGKLTKLKGTLAQKHQLGILASALSGQNYAGATPEQQAAKAAQLRQLLEPQFETSEGSDGEFQTRHKQSGRPASEVLKEALASPDYEHFFAPKARGGSGSDATRSAGNQPTGEIKPGSVEWYAANMAAGKTEFPTWGFGARPK